MPLMRDFLRSSYARLQALAGSNKQRKTGSESAQAESGENDTAQFEQARVMHQQGQIGDAEAIYRMLLQKYPHDADLLHMLGTTLGQRNNFEAALELIERALELAPNNAAIHGSHGNCFKGLHKYDRALASYSRALALQPDDANILCDRGSALKELNRLEEALDSYGLALAVNPNHVLALDNRGVTLRDLKRSEEALANHDRALEIDCNYAPAHYNRGVILGDLGRYDEACYSFDKALSLHPHHRDALINRGFALTRLKRFEESLIFFERAVELTPHDPVMQCNRGAVLHELKRHEEALASFDRAIGLRLNYVDALVNRGVTLSKLHRHVEALDSIEKALEIDPGNSSAHYNCGIILGNLNRFEKALASYDKALVLQPDYVEVHNNRGFVLRELRRDEKALHSFEKALAISPDHLSALFNRGNLLVDLKRPDEAITDFEKIIKIEPDYKFSRSLLLHAKMWCCNWHDVNTLWSAISKGIQRGEKSAEPFCCLSVCAFPNVIKRCAEIYSAQRPKPIFKFASKTSKPDKKVRLGYVSGEFRHHATSILMTELFERHDKNLYELFAFDNGWNDGSTIRRRQELAFTRIINISRLGDIEAADTIRSLQVDILIDLNGYFGLGRQGVFAQRAAPVQVNWLGYPGTTGAAHMDYIIADANVIPEGHEVHYTEKVVRLPDTYQVNDSQRSISAHTPTRAEAHLPDTGFVFCCFNNNYKIVPEIFDVWMRLLDKVAHSVIWLLEDNAAASRNLRSEAAARGISPNRLVFAPRMELADHLARHRLADLFLDTVPCNAHTSASDALWTGLPLLTCVGSTFAGRVASSLLHAVGLPELITESLCSYENVALKLATTPALLSELRNKLANNKKTHALFNGNRFRLHIESAYSTMYERWLRGEAPTSFDVARIAQ